ncbi:DNA-formamidopyrimidine glycosylase, partial [Candidatus Roizmanbacteria bacterium RIFCSPHIGHO2_01_FULL_35_10]
MPELPEVETIRKGLEKYIVGKKIIDVELLNTRLLQGQIVHLKGVQMIAVRRFGKGLVIDLDNHYSLAIHIKLTGQFIYKGPEAQKIDQDKKLVGDLPSKFTRVIFKFNKNSVLYFNDMRRFAWLKVVKTNELNKIPFFNELGPEPFKDLKLDYFQKVIKKSNSAIKSLLMDQKKIGGIGNIYSNDALNLARIDPSRKASSLTDKENKKLFEAVHAVLKRGLRYGGATEINFVNAIGQGGKYQEHFLTYGRQKQKCYNCGDIIKKIRLSGRGT